MSTGPRPPSTRSGRALRAAGAQPGAASLDDTDRKLLALLAEDATRTYAELGKLLFLSAPAVHERARR